MVKGRPERADGRTAQLVLAYEDGLAGAIGFAVEFTVEFKPGGTGVE
jgi:hypothetical protein